MLVFGEDVFKNNNAVNMVKVTLKQAKQNRIDCVIITYFLRQFAPCLPI